MPVWHLKTVARQAGVILSGQHSRREAEHLKSRLPEAMERGYKYAINGAAGKTGLSKTTFPETCPWSFDQAMDNEFFPE